MSSSSTTNWVVTSSETTSFLLISGRWIMHFELLQEGANWLDWGHSQLSKPYVAVQQQICTYTVFSNNQIGRTQHSTITHHRRAYVHCARWPGYVLVLFHRTIAQKVVLMQSCKDTQTAVVFLCTRVKETDEDHWKNWNGYWSIWMEQCTCH